MSYWVLSSKSSFLIYSDKSPPPPSAAFLQITIGLLKSLLIKTTIPLLSVFEILAII